MMFLFAIPGGAEWAFLMPLYALLLIAPIFAIVYYSKNKKLQRELKAVTQERDELFKKKLMDRTN